MYPVTTVTILNVVTGNLQSWNRRCFTFLISDSTETEQFNLWEIHFSELESTLLTKYVHTHRKNRDRNRHTAKQGQPS